MVNLVEITVRATDDTKPGFDAVKAKAIKAGDDAGKAFSDAFKLRADATIHASDKAGGTGLVGEDKSLLNKLKSFADTPGGIGILGTGSDTSLISTLKHAIQQSAQQGGLGLLGGVGNGAGETSSKDIIKQVMAGKGPGNTTSDDFVKQVLEGSGASNVTTDDFIKQMVEGTKPGNITTEDFIKQVTEGIKPGNIETKDIIHPSVDDTDIKALGEKDGDTYGSSFGSKLKQTIGNLFSNSGKGGGGGSFIGNLLTGTGDSGESGGGGGGPLEAVKSTLDKGGIVGGALPGIGNISGFAATVTGLAGALIAVLPAITSVVAGLGAIGGGFAILETTDKKFAADMTSTLGTIEGVFKEAAAPLAAPLEKAASEIAGYFKQLEPVFQQIFGDSGQLVQPLLKAIEGLVSGVLPGFLAMIKSGAPVFQAFAGSMSDLGKDLGDMFSDFAQAGPGSATILKSLMDVIGSLLPFIGTLAKSIVTAVAPAFAAFSGAVSAVLPALTPLMSILGQLAGAVLTDLAGVLQPIGTLLVDLAPSFTTLAKAAGQVFTALENDGVFATLATVIENLAAPLANLVNALVKGLAPAIPGIVNFVGQLATVFADLASAGLTVIVNAFTKLVQILSPFLPAVLDVIAAVKGLSIAFGILDAVMSLNPFVAIGIAMVAIAALIIKYHTQIYNFIVSTWDAVSKFVFTAWDAIYNTAKSVWDSILAFIKQWGQDLLVLFGPVGFLAAVVINVIKYHADIEKAIETAWDDILSFLKSVVSSIEGALSSAWDDIRNLAVSAWDLIVAEAKAIWGSLVSFFEGIPHDVVSAMDALPGDMMAMGKQIIEDFLSGAESIWGGVESWFKGAWNDVVGWAKDILGVFSPSTVFHDIGLNLMKGLSNGIQAGESSAVNAAKKSAAAVSSAGQVTAGVSQWTSTVQQALKMEGLPLSLTGNILYQMQTESGGNPNAINLTDINAQEGDPSRGLMQVIGTTFAAYHWPGTSDNIYNPLANIAAAINYARNVYGPNLENGYGGIGSGHGYAAGGPGSGWAMVGEQGRELVRLPGGSTVIPHGGTEAMMGANGGVNVCIEIGSSSNQTFDAMMLQWLKNNVRVKGGGNVQRAYGHPNAA